MNAVKALQPLAGTPLIQHTYNRLSGTVDEVIVVSSSREQSEMLARVLPSARIVADRRGAGTPMDGAETGLRAAYGVYTFLVGADMPFIDPRVVVLLFAAAEGRSAATPAWTNGYVEPLHAVYRSGEAAEATLRLVESGENRLRMILLGLPDVARVPVEEIRRIDPELLTLRDVDSRRELAEAERILSLR